MKFTVIEETELLQLSRVEATEQVSGVDGWYTRPHTTWRISHRADQSEVAKVTYRHPHELQVSVSRALAFTPARWLAEILSEVTADMSIGSSTGQTLGRSASDNRSPAPV